MLLTEDERAASAVINPEIAKFLEANPFPPSDPADIGALRAVMHTVDKQATAGPFPAGVNVSYHDVTMRDGHQSQLKIQRPANASERGPLIVLIFGGSYMAGSHHQLTVTAMLLVQLFGATVASISYRLGPEHKFPMQQLDAWDNLIWIAQNAEGDILNADPTKGFIGLPTVGGVSAGGGITAAMTRKAQLEPLAHPITGQWLAVPSVMGRDNAPEKYRSYCNSYEQNAEAPILRTANIMFGLKATEADTKSPLRYAILSPSPAQDQPRSYFQVDGLDPLRDDGLLYHQVLHDAGVDTRIDFYPGCPHAHFTAFAGLNITHKANIDTLLGFAWLLGKDLDRKHADEVMRASKH